MDDDFLNPNQLWRKCEMAWLSHLQVEGWSVTPSTEFVNNAQRRRGPVIHVGGRTVRSPDLLATKAGRSEYWEVKHRSRSTVDFVTGQREHWMEVSAFRDYHHLRQTDRTPVWIILYEGTVTTPGRWLRISVDDLAASGKGGQAINAHGELVDAWFWPVTAMTVVEGPNVNLQGLGDPLLPLESHDEIVNPNRLLKLDELIPLERNLRGSRRPKEDSMSSGDDADSNEIRGARALAADPTLGLDVLRRDLGLDRIPRYSVLFIGASKEELPTILRLLDYGIRVFLVTEFDFMAEKDSVNWIRFVATRLLEVGTSKKATKNLRVIDGVMPKDDNYFRTVMQDAEVGGGINYKQYLIVHAAVEMDILVTAGAGTGKTETMSERIVFLLATSDQGPTGGQLQLSDISLVTFTRQAAAEMRKRISRTLLYRLRLADKSVQPALAWLMQLSHAQITTIHGFARELVQVHAGDLGIAPGFRVSTLTMDFRDLVREGISADLVDLFQEHPSQVPASHLWIKQIEYMWSQLWSKGIDLGGMQTSDVQSILDWGRAPEATKESANNAAVARAIQKGIENLATKYAELQRSEQAISTDQLVPNGIAAISLPTATFSKKYLFLDEFQDTDGLQMDLVLAVKQKSTAKLFLVGDVKQAIYRFRGAEGDAFQEMRNRVRERHLPPLTEFSLSMNFRSTETILERLNSLFVEWSKRNLLDYSPSDQLKANPTNSGTGQGVRFIKVDSKQVQAKIKARVDEWRTQDQKCDVAILCRTNKQALAAHKALRAGGQDCELIVGGTFFQSPAVRELVALLLALREPENTAHVLQVCQTRWAGGLVDDNPPPDIGESFGAAWGQANSIIDWNGRLRSLTTSDNLDVDDIGFLFRRLHLLRGLAKRMSLVDFVSWVYANLAPYEVTREEPDESERRRYRRCSDHLIGILDDNFAESPQTLDSLLSWLQLSIATNTSEDEPFEKKDLENKVTALTVHKAKGLEFSHVLVPHTDSKFINKYQKSRVAVVRTAGGKNKILWEWKPNGSRFTNVEKIEDWSLEESQTKLEETRLLYVALTRAKGTLEVFLPANRKPKLPPEQWSDLIELGGDDLD